MSSENILSTIEHKANVGHLMADVIGLLIRRAVIHDNSKFAPEEFDAFEEATPKLKTLSYGSAEYEEARQSIMPALEHHYKVNSHHPEHFSDGVTGMDLLDLIEMLCDWMAATMRHNDGDILKSLFFNKIRFNISDQLFDILNNTRVRVFGRQRYFFYAKLTKNKGKDSGYRIKFPDFPELLVPHTVMAKNDVYNQEISNFLAKHITVDLFQNGKSLPKVKTAKELGFADNEKRGEKLGYMPYSISI